MANTGLNPSFRRPNNIPVGAAHDTVRSAIQSHDNSITDLNQAIVVQAKQISALSSSSTSSSSGTSTTNQVSTENVTTNNIFSGGTVNDQSGETLYRTVQEDNGALLILNDASPVAIQLNQQVTLPYWIFIVNQGSSLVTVTPTAGTISYAGNPAAVSLPIASGAFAIVALDMRGDFWAGTIPSGYSLGGDLSPANITLGSGAGTGATISNVFGTDGNHSIVITIGSSPVASNLIYEVTYTSARIRGVTGPLPVVGLTGSTPYTALDQIPTVGGFSSGSYFLRSGATPLAAGDTYAFYVSCP